MSDEPTPTARLRRFRFGLRTLLALMTLAAVGSWGYWVGWPWWRVYREQHDFEASVKQLTVGVNSTDGLKQLRSGTATSKIIQAGDIQAREALTIGVYSWKNACYCVFFVDPGRFPGPSMTRAGPRIEAYRLPPIPRNYQSRSGPFSNDPLSDYIWDFYWWTFEKQQSSIMLQYELIYSDPPARPVGK